MRKILLFFILIPILAGQTVWGQNEWAPVGSKWYYQENYFMSPDTGFAFFEVTEDTIINGINCSIIKGKGGFWYFPGWNLLSYDTIMYAYTYKMNDTVFFYNKEQNIFVPVFFFNTNEGDHWIFTWDWCNFDFVVDSIRFYMNNGVNQKFFYIRNLDNWNRVAIIENIGGTYLFTQGIWCDTIAIDGAMLDGLRCYYDPQFGLFTYTTLPCNYTADILENIYNNSERSIIFPNPVSNTINFNFDVTEFPVDISIYSFSGIRLYKEVIYDNQAILINPNWDNVLYIKIGSRTLRKVYKIINRKN